VGEEHGRCALRRGDELDVGFEHGPLLRGQSCVNQTEESAVAHHAQGAEQGDHTDEEPAVGYGVVSGCDVDVLRLHPEIGLMQKS
jgi:hypothetical protein